jgi:hypothetical protein
VDWSLIANIAGLALSGAGFWFTIQQLVRTAKATEAVKAAVGGLKNRMAVFDYVSECMHAGRSLQHTTQLLRLKQWADAASTLSDVQLVLNRVAASHEGTQEVRNFAKTASDGLLDSIRELEEAADKGLDFNPSQLVTALRKLRNMLDTETIGATKGIYDA